MRGKLDNDSVFAENVTFIFLKTSCMRQFKVAWKREQNKMFYSELVNV